MEVLERVSEVEHALARFIYMTEKSFASLHNEMKEFKDEMKEFKDEMKTEMKEFKSEMKDFKEEARRETREMKKQWGDLANKMGTLVEDIVAPAVRPVMQQFFGEEIIDYGYNLERYNKALNVRGEFDVIAASDSYLFLVDTKSSPNQEHLAKFPDLIARCRSLYPEHKDKKMIPILASLVFKNDEYIKQATKLGIYLLAYREWEYMDLLNFKDIQLLEKS